MLIALADLWIIEVYWEVMIWSYFYNSGWNSGREKYDYFKIKYVKFKDIWKKDNINVLKNYISWNSIYLNLETDLDDLEKLAKFTILEWVNQYVILKLSRELLIKAKNKYNLTSKEILNFLKTDLVLDIPKNIEMMLNDLESKKDDILIMKSWMPLIVSEYWMYNDIINLKMFNKHILYKDDSMKLIIFSKKFWSLENLLTKRNIIFKIV